MRANNVSFNHDSSCVVVATENGFRILKADSGALLHKFDTIGPMRICEMLRDTRLIVCVGDGGGLETPDLSPRRLKILKRGLGNFNRGFGVSDDRKEREDEQTRFSRLRGRRGDGVRNERIDEGDERAAKEC